MTGAVRAIVAQLRTTDLDASIRFFTDRLGWRLAWRYEDGYAAIVADGHMVHLKRVPERDPGIAQVAEQGHFHLYVYVNDLAAIAALDLPVVEPPHGTPWGTREMIVTTDQGHTVHFGEAITS